MKMRKVAIAGIVAVFVLCIASQSVSAGVNSANVYGWITDGGGNPIVNATVEWKNNATGDFLVSRNTTPAGYYSMTHTFDGTIESLIVASKYCYCTNSTVIMTTAGFIPILRYEVNFTLASDDEPPEITNFQPADGSCINDSTPTICADYNDGSGSGIDTSSVIMKVDGADVTGDATVTATDVCYTPTTSLSEGEHTVMVNVSDLCGNPNSTSWSFTVDTIAPTIEFQEPPTPVNNTEVTVNYVNVSVNVTDSGCGIDNATVVMTWNETAYQMVEHMFAFTEGKYFLNMTDLPNGEYTYWVQANDIAGNIGVSETRIVTVNVTEVKYNVSVTLKTDWNMFGVPLNVSDWTLPAVLTSIDGKYTYISYYNATSEEMEYYDPLDLAGSTLKALEQGAGYLISMSEDAIASFEGRKLMGLERSLKADWNMFSIPYGVVDETLPAVLTSIDGKYTYISYYNATSEEMEYYDPLDPVGSTLKALEPGAGYLISMTEDAVFIPDMGS